MNSDNPRGYLQIRMQKKQNKQNKDKGDLCRFIQNQQKRAGNKPMLFKELIEMSEQELANMSYRLTRAIGATMKLENVAKVREPK